MHTSHRLLKNFNKNLAGFTLVEVLIVTLMVGALATIFSTSFNVTEKQKEQRDLARLNELSKYASALEMYFLDNKKYPVAANLLDTLKDYNNTLLDKDPSGCAYKYTQIDSGKGYSIISVAESSGVRPPKGQSIIFESCSGTSCNATSSCPAKKGDFKLSR